MIAEHFGARSQRLLSVLKLENTNAFPCDFVRILLVVVTLGRLTSAVIGEEVCFVIGAEEL